MEAGVCQIAGFCRGYAQIRRPSSSIYPTLLLQMTFTLLSEYEPNFIVFIEFANAGFYRHFLGRQRCTSKTIHFVELHFCFFYYTALYCFIQLKWLMSMWTGFFMFLLCCCLSTINRFTECATIRRLIYALIYISIQVHKNSIHHHWTRRVFSILPYF